MANKKGKRFDVIVPYTYTRGDEERTGWDRVGAAFQSFKEDGSEQLQIILNHAVAEKRFLLVEPKAKDEKPARVKREREPGEDDGDVSFPPLE